MKYDSTQETLTHINTVDEFGNKIVVDFSYRLKVHDKSKLEPEEKLIFDEFTPKLKGTTYGSDEYNEYLTSMKVALSHHYANNRHHPEHFENGIKDMTLVDLIEMITDWKAATLRHNDGDIMKSIELNQSRFGYSDELKQIFINTVKYYF